METTKSNPAPTAKFAALAQTPVFPQTLHQARPPKAHMKPAKRDNVFSKSRDVREDRGTRAAKTAQSSKSFPHVR